MALVAISIKFEPHQRDWLQAQANLHHKGRISTTVKALVDRTIKRQPRKAS